ncbi:hypothetical protein [Dokdonia sp. Asnod2-E02]|uniref:hypothetical protein n=1 Tax=Dokdonia sp. Asnod2-E02 TaxID=3160574 RepID=UPI003865552C
MDESEVKDVVEIEKETSESNSVAESYIENDSLVIVLKSELEKIALNEKFTIEKKPIQNRHVDNLVDTIITRLLKTQNLRLIKQQLKNGFIKLKSRILNLN